MNNFVSAFEDNEAVDASQRRIKPFTWLLLGILVTGLVLWALYLWLQQLNTPPSDFPNNVQITIEQGMDVRAISKTLAAQRVVRSETFLYYVLAFTTDATKIKASTYVFEAPLSTFAVAQKLVEGDFDTDLIRFTHFEGERVEQLATRASVILSNFSAADFIELAEPHEGTLFPETYFIPVDYSEEELFDLLHDTYVEKTSSLTEQIKMHELTQEEIIILASIIEREANTLESKEYVSGILQNRLKIGMPLQADASIEYILDKPLSELVPADLEIESPYNTYLNQGLPPTPIGNPGLESIMAVLEPTESNYLFYITGNDGEFYYSETYEGHLLNIKKHLR